MLAPKKCLRTKQSKFIDVTDICKEEEEIDDTLVGYIKKKAEKIEEDVLSLRELLNEFSFDDMDKLTEENQMLLTTIDSLQSEIDKLKSEKEEMKKKIQEFTESFF